MTPREEEAEKHEAGRVEELDQYTEEYLPAPDKAREEVTHGSFAEFPAWFKRAYLLMARVEHAADLSQQLRAMTEDLSRRIEKHQISVDDLVREVRAQFGLVATDRVSALSEMIGSGAKLYWFLGVETRLEPVLLAFDTEGTKIENQIRTFCYTPQWLAGQPLSPLMARYLDYRRDYRQYLEAAITEGRRDEVREQGLRQQWMSHIALIGTTVNELSERLDMAMKRRERTKAVTDVLPHQKPKKTTKDRFTFNAGQAMFDGKDLGLPSDAPIAVLKKLVDNFGNVVPYKDFDCHYSSATPGALPKSVTKIRKAFRSHKVPCEIKSKTGAGYFIREIPVLPKRKKPVRKRS